MSKPTTPVLPPLEYLPESARTNTIQTQLEQSKSTKTNRGGYIQPGSSEQADFYEEINQRNSRSIEKFKKAAKSNPFVPIGTCLYTMLFLILNFKLNVILGCLITIGVLANGILAFRNKDRLKSQRMMRYRVLCKQLHLCTAKIFRFSRNVS